MEICGGVFSIDGLTMPSSQNVCDVMDNRGSDERHTLQSAL